jgi:nitrogenase molybdenum-iron protein beta chain
MARLLDQQRFVCATGAMQTVQGIHRAAPIVHAGPGCTMKLASGVSGGNGNSGYISPQIYPCTQISEKEVIFGGGDRLRETIENALKVLDADFFVVVTGCTPEIVGDNVAEVVGSFKNAEKPVIYAETAGFKGNNVLGHEWVVDAIIEQYLDKPLEKQKGLVNIWGPIPSYDPFWLGNIRELESLLRELGLIPNCIFGEYRGVPNIDRIPAAEFNLLVAPWVGLKNVQKLEKKFGTPYLHIPALPVGAYETGNFLSSVGGFAGVPDSKIAEIVERHEREYYYYIEKNADNFLETRAMARRFVNIGMSDYALALSRFLINDMGLFPSKQYITEDTPEEYREQVREHFRHFRYGIEAEVEFSVDGYKIHDEIRHTDFYGYPLILGSSWDEQISEELNGHFLAVHPPAVKRLVLSSSYVGYHGGLKLLEDIYTVVFKVFN